MAITIRKLSINAEIKLDKIIEEKSFISTKTKGIEYALEQHGFYKSFEKKYYDLLREYNNLSSKLEDVKKAVKLLQKL